MPSAGTLDYRLGEPQFRRYEPLINQALAAWPAVSSFPCPKEYALSTFLARFRDVLLSYRENRWPSALFSWEQFSPIDEQSVLRSDPERNCVIWDHKKRQGRQRAFAVGTSVSGSPASTTSQLGPFELSPEEQHAFCLLLNNNRLTNVTVAVSHPLSIDTSTYPNVAEAPHTGGITLLF